MLENSFSIITLFTIKNILLRKITLDKFFLAIKNNGLFGVDMLNSEINLYGKKKIKRLLDKHELKLNCLIVSISLTSFNEKKITKEIEKNIELLKYFNCNKLMIVPLGNRDSRTKPVKDFDLVKENILKGFNLITNMIIDSDIELLFEDTPNCYYPLSSIDDCNYYLQNNERLRLVFDTANMVVMEDTPLDFYFSLKDKITYAHLKNYKYVNFGNDYCKDKRRVFGTSFDDGLIDVKEIYALMLKNNYQGDFAIEFYPPKKRGYEAYYQEIKKYIDYLK